MKCFCILIALAAIIIVISAKKFRLYEKVNYEGEYMDFTADDYKCHNSINETFDNRGSSIITYGDCVVLFEDPGCTGLFRTFKSNCTRPGCGFRKDLSTCGFNDMASSFRFC
uniref:Beta/gamma crystallin 'Greek key' domain-containing protein n=1 Tax=Panagrolaimus sp. PS1159 TaxID=55785 RepID=A0AC35GK82_9BILA